MTDRMYLKFVEGSKISPFETISGGYGLKKPFPSRFTVAFDEYSFIIRMPRAMSAYQKEGGPELSVVQVGKCLHFLFKRRAMQQRQTRILVSKIQVDERYH